MNALEASILHWKENLNNAKSGDEYCISSASCALCWAYCDGLACIGCPVSEKTGQTGCGGSPWENVSDSVHKHGPYAPSTIDAIKEEIAFLESLQ